MDRVVGWYCSRQLSGFIPVPAALCRAAHNLSKFGLRLLIMSRKKFQFSTACPQPLLSHFLYGAYFLYKSSWFPNPPPTSERDIFNERCLVPKRSAYIKKTASTVAVDYCCMYWNKVTWSTSNCLCTWYRWVLQWCLFAHSCSFPCHSGKLG